MGDDGRRDRVDRPRYLAPLGYTDNANAAIDKLEAVRRDEQEEMTRRAHRAEHRRELEAWHRARGQILGALDGFRRECNVISRPAHESLRRVVREVDRLDARLRS
jgi:hypothetical protein